MIAEFDTYYVQAIQEKDAWKLCDFIATNDDRLKRYFPKTIAQNLTPTLSSYFAQKKVEKFINKEEFLFTIKEKKTKNIIGLVYIKDVNWNDKHGEFAYCIDYAFEGKKIITRAIHKLSEYAFSNLGLIKLRIIVNKDNISSAKVAVHNKFTWVRTLINEYTPPNEKPMDMELYELNHEG